MTILAETVYTTRSTINQTISSTTLANVTSLSFSILAGALYTFKFALAFTPSVAPLGTPQVGVTFPTSSVFAARFTHQGNIATLPGIEQFGQLVTSGVGVSPSANMSDTTSKFLLVVNGVILPTSDGTLQLQLGENTDNNAQPYVVFAGALGILRRVG